MKAYVVRRHSDSIWGFKWSVSCEAQLQEFYNDEPGENYFISDKVEDLVMKYITDKNLFHIPTLLEEFNLVQGRLPDGDIVVVFAEK